MHGFVIWYDDLLLKFYSLSILMVWAHGTGMMFSGCPCINTIPHDSLSVLSGQTAMKLAINIRHVSGHCLNHFLWSGVKGRGHF